MGDADTPLPTLVYVDQAFNQRLPTQRVMDMLAKLEPGVSLGDLVQTRMPQLVAFRVLLRDYPTRDATSLWLHAYDVEVQIQDTDPTNGNGLTPSQLSAVTGA